MLFFALLASLAAASAIDRRSHALTVVDNVMPLRTVQGMLPSTRMLLETRLKSVNNTPGHDIPLTSVDYGYVFIAPVQVGNDTYEVVIDTGSSNPWLAEKGYSCFNPIAPKAKPRCKFGKPYTPDASLRRIPNRNFNISYADGEELLGTMGYEKMVMAGFEVSKQEFGLVNRAGWLGDGTSSGLFGFAYRSLTMSYKGTDPDTDEPHQVIHYNPLFTNMIARGVPPVFSLVISQSNKGTGVMSLGGIPKGYESLHYISTPIHQTVINTHTGRKVSEFYAINPSHFVYSNKSDGSLVRHSAHDIAPGSETRSNGGLSRRKPVYALPSDYILDSGTSEMYIGDHIMKNLAHQFDPPAMYHPQMGSYVVSCNAVAPKFGIGFGKDVIYVAARDLIIRTGEKDCQLGVQPSGVGNYLVLGGTFLKNVVAVYDVGNSQMHFAQRQADD